MLHVAQACARYPLDYLLDGICDLNIAFIAQGAASPRYAIAGPSYAQVHYCVIGPIGMLLAGMAISEIPFKKIFMEKRNYLAVLLRLFIYPLVVLIVFKVLDLTDWIADGKNLLLIVFLACVTPACATVTSMAQLYDKNSAEASLFYVLTTLFSIISMPLMILVFEIFC